MLNTEIQQVVKITLVQALWQEWLETYQPLVEMAAVQQSDTAPVVLEKGRNGLATLKVSVGAESFYLHSTRNPQEEAERWLEGFELAPEAGPFLVYGLGLGHHLRALRAFFPQARIAVVEANLGLLRVVLEKGNLQELLQDERLTLLAASPQKLQEALSQWLRALTEEERRHFRLLYHDPSLRAAPPAAKDVREIFEYHQSAEQAARRLPFSQEYHTHREAYLRGEATPGKPFSRLNNRFKGFAAVVVGAGPSLDLNVHHLREVGDRALIVCVDVAVKTLLAHGVTPHVVATLDPQIHTPKYQRFFEGIKNPPGLLLHSLGSCPALTALYPSDRRYCFIRSEDLKDERVDHMGFGPPDVLEKNSSVFFMALNALKQMGVTVMVLVGSDLAVLRDRTHTTHMQAEPLEETTWEGLREIPGYHGGWVRTLPVFYLFLRNIENFAKKNPDLKIINATEGGARIAGVAQWPLEKVVHELLPEK